MQQYDGVALKVGDFTHCPNLFVSALSVSDSLSLSIVASASASAEAEAEAAAAERPLCE